MRTVESGVGIHALTFEQRSINGQRNGRIRDVCPHCGTLALSFAAGISTTAPRSRSFVGPVPKFSLSGCKSASSTLAKSKWRSLAVACRRSTSRAALGGPREPEP
jgi:hypothetical protein